MVWCLLPFDKAFRIFHFPLFSCYSYSHSLVGRTDTIQNCIVRERTHTHTFVSLSISSDRFEERVGERRRKRAQWNGNSLAFKCNLIKICIVHLLHSWIFCSIVQMCNRILRATHTLNHNPNWEHVVPSSSKMLWILHIIWLMVDLILHTI